MNSLRLYWTLARPFTLIPPMVGIFSGAVVGSAASHAPFRVLHVALAVVAVGLLNAGSNALNQIYDLSADRINKPHRPLPSGTMTMTEVWTFVAFAYIVALVMVAVVSWQTFGLYAIAAVATMAYSTPPLRLKAHPFGSNLTIAMIRGELLIVAGWSAVSSVLVSIEPWYIGFVLFLFLLGATTTKDFADVDGDRASACVTLPVRYGVEWSARAISPAFIVPWLLLPLGVLPGIIKGNAIAIFVLSAVLLVWGIYVVHSMNRSLRSLMTARESRRSWRHMYWMMMICQAGLATAYLL